MATVARPGLKKLPPQPSIKINNVPNGIVVSWNISGLNQEHAEIHSYQIYAYEVTSAAATSDNWKHVGDVKALLLPMAVTLTQFQEGENVAKIYRRTLSTNVIINRTKILLLGSRCGCSPTSGSVCCPQDLVREQQIDNVRENLNQITSIIL